MKDYMKIYNEWLSNPYFDEETKAELRAIEGDENEIKERFYMDLEFGTAGLRGIIGAGINRMNIWLTTLSSRAAQKKELPLRMIPVICLRNLLWKQL